MGDDDEKRLADSLTVLLLPFFLLERPQPCGIQALPLLQSEEEKGNSYPLGALIRGYPCLSLSRWGQVAAGGLVGSQGGCGSSFPSAAPGGCSGCGPKSSRPGGG